MSLAYFDCFAGISGDMVLGAVVDAGLPFGELFDEIGKLPLHGEVELSCRTVQRSGVSGTKVDVRATENAGHRHRHLGEILAIIGEGGISAQVKETSSHVFERLAAAEGKVHGVESREVHFHEVGGVDAIVDIVGAVAGLELLGVTQVRSSALKLGSGFVECSHGRLPVPVPGVLELCRGVPIERGDVQAELVTPTGAAIITTLSGSFGPPPPMRLDRIGYGAGDRDTPGLPNLLRLEIGDTVAAAEEDGSVLIETNIDDMTPEIYGYVMDRLFAEGAKDVYLTQVMMKKGRPGILVSVLGAPVDVHRLCGVLLGETTTIGVRIQEVKRIKAARVASTVTTPLGELRVKIAEVDGRRRVTPEYEDCARVAREKAVPILEVYRAVERAMCLEERT